MISYFAKRSLIISLIIQGIIFGLFFLGGIIGGLIEKGSFDYSGLYAAILSLQFFPILFIACFAILFGSEKIKRQLKK